jgi:hypothetical protein
MPVRVEGSLPEPGTIIKLGDADAGEIRTGQGHLALALLRLEAIDEAGKTGASLRAGDARVTPIKPSWARF